MRRCLILVSGGIESSVLCALLRSQDVPIYGLFVDRGQRALEEEQHAWANLQRCVKFEEPIFTLSVSLKDFRPLISEEIRKDLGIPGRNLINAALAIPLAVGKGCDAIAIGCSTADDLPDCSEDFLKLFSQAMAVILKSKYIRTPIQLVAPLHDAGLDKAGAIKWAYDHGLGDLLQSSFSCLLPEKGQHCGTCFACANRRSAFEIAKIADPTRYVRRLTSDGNLVCEGDI